MLVRHALSRVRPRRLLPLMYLLTALTLVSCGQPADGEDSSGPEENSSSVEENADGDPDENAASLEEGSGEDAGHVTAQEFAERVSDGGAADYEAHATPSELVQASSLVILGEVIDVRPGLKVERENTIPEGYEPDELIDEDADGFTSDPEADEPPARTLPERSMWLSFVAVDVRVEDSLTVNASPGDVVTIQVMSGQETADGGEDLDYQGPVLVAGEALPESWSDHERLHLDWSEAGPAPLSETYSPFMDGLWLEAADGVVGAYGMQLFDSFGEPDDLDGLFMTLKSSSDAQAE